MSASSDLPCSDHSFLTPPFIDEASAVLLGSTIFHSFIGGPITYKTVPRAQFRAIQSNIFPVLFSAQTFVSGALLGLWIRLHPSVQSVSGLFDVSRPDAITGLCLAAMTATGALNLAVVGPATTKSVQCYTLKICSVEADVMFRVMNERVKQEESEGKTHDQPGVSSAIVLMCSKTDAGCHC